MNGKCLVRGEGTGITGRWDLLSKVVSQEGPWFLGQGGDASCPGDQYVQ